MVKSYQVVVMVVGGLIVIDYTVNILGQVSVIVISRPRSLTISISIASLKLLVYVMCFVVWPMKL